MRLSGVVGGFKVPFGREGVLEGPIVEWCPGVSMKPPSLIDLQRSLKYALVLTLVRAWRPQGPSDPVARHPLGVHPEQVHH